MHHMLAPQQLCSLGMDAHAVQGISANTACFNSLSYQAGGARIHGLMQYQTTLDKADLYLDGPSQRHLQTTEASVARYA